MERVKEPVLRIVRVGTLRASSDNAVVSALGGPLIGPARAIFDLAGRGVGLPSRRRHDDRSGREPKSAGRSPLLRSMLFRWGHGPTASRHRSSQTSIGSGNAAIRRRGLPDRGPSRCATGDESLCTACLHGSPPERSSRRPMVRTRRLARAAVESAGRAREKRRRSAAFAAVCREVTPGAPSDLRRRSLIGAMSRNSRTAAPAAGQKAQRRFSRLTDSAAWREPSRPRPPRRYTAATSALSSCKAISRELMRIECVLPCETIRFQSAHSRLQA